MLRDYRDDRFNYTKPGEFKLKELQCTKCMHKLQNPMLCTEYPERKPNCVLKIECDCPKFEPKE